MWINAPLSRCKLFFSEKHAAILVLALCVTLRAIPELVAYPHPIGYDVVNYYIPVVDNFDEHWSTVASQFPLYVLFLHSVQLATEMSAQMVVTAVAIGMFGIFGTSLYYLGRSVLKLSLIQSIFLSTFVIFQMAVLRTAWDLHRDIFALTAMMFVFSLLARNNRWKEIVVVLALAAIAVAADRMIGTLLCISLIAYAAITRRKDTIAVSIFATGLFSVLLITSYSTPSASVNSLEMLIEKTPVFYDPQNLLVLFAVANGLLVAPAVIGFLRTKDYMLKVPLLASIIGSFSWLAFPDIGQLVADRWIILAGIFLAIFAGCGILHIIKNLKPYFSIAIAASVLIGFAAIGVAYAVMPYDSPFPLYGMTGQNIENFGPLTMQFNSMDIRDNDELLSSIEWINKNTEADAVIVGEKHWRGFMELYLEDERTYRFSDNPPALAEAVEKQGKSAYHITFDSGQQPMFAVEDVAIR
ncbi:MAG: hypothetical protein AB1351_10255 [Thermoproteota archaeon]